MTTLLRHHDTVVKTMNAAVTDPYFAAMPADATAVTRYAAVLRDAGVPLPGDLDVSDGTSGTEVRHAWVPGPTLLELPGWRSEELLAGVASIARWIRALEHTDARLDANLANFVIPDGGGVTCIDVLPALLASRRPGGAGPWEQVIGSLCFDIDVTLCALAGYAARHLLRELEPGPSAAASVTDVLRVCPGHAAPDALASRWFHSRLLAAGMAAGGRLPVADAEMLFSATSVRSLQMTPPSGRHQHADTALTAVTAILGKGTS